MARKKTRHRPYAIDASEVFELPTGSELDFAGSEEDEERVDDYVSVEEPTSSQTPSGPPQSEAEIEATFSSTTGKTIIDLLYHIGRKVSGKGNIIVMFGGFAISLYAIKPTSWKDLIIALTATIFWGLVLCGFVFVENKIKSK